jgi:hypothetical protein
MLPRLRIRWLQQMLHLILLLLLLLLLHLMMGLAVQQTGLLEVLLRYIWRLVLLLELL